MTFKASVSRNACSIPDAIVFAATASPKPRALRVTPSPLSGPISRMITAFIMREICAREGGMTPPDSSDHLPAIIQPGPLTSLTDTSSSAGADRRRRRAGRLALRRILHRQHPQPEHAPGLCARCGQFFAWCEDRGLTLTTIRPFDVATRSSRFSRPIRAPGVKQQLAAVRMLFDWLITGQVVPINPASAVRGPKHVVKTGKTPVLDAADWRKLIDTHPDRDRARSARPGADRHPHLFLRAHHGAR